VENPRSLTRIWSRRFCAIQAVLFSK